MTKDSEHDFEVLFQIPGAVEPDEYAVRGYEDDGLRDFALCGPDEDGIFEGHFIRDADSFEQAVLGAIADLTRVFPEAQMLRVEPDSLATITSIAERLGRSHESVRLIVRGKRGPGGFPRSAAVDGKTQVWRWNEVVDWFEQTMGITVSEGQHATFLAALNDILDLQRLAPRAMEDSELAGAMASLLPKELTAVR